MYRFTIGQDGKGRDFARAEWSGQSHEVRSRNGAAMGLARALRDAGAPDGPIEAYGQPGDLRWSHASLHELARWTLVETDRGITRALWRPFPDIRPTSQAV